jgi:hypothetical protein
MRGSQTCKKTARQRLVPLSGVQLERKSPPMKRPAAKVSAGGAESSNRRARAKGSVRALRT